MIPSFLQPPCFGILALAVSLFATVVPAAASIVPTGAEIPVNQFFMGDQDRGVVAADPRGGFVVVWESASQDTDLDAVVARRFDADGMPLGGEVVVNTEIAGNQADPDVAVARDGSFVVVWDSDGAQDGEARGIYGQRFGPDGLRVGDEFLVNQVTVGDQNDAVVAMIEDSVLGNLGFVVVWEDEAPGSNEELLGRRFAIDATPLGDAFPINVLTAFDQEDADVASDAAGRFVVAWETIDSSLDGIAARVFDPDGTPRSGEVPVNTFLTGDQENPSLAVAPDGGFIVVWEDDEQEVGDLSIFGRFFDASGVAVDAPFQIDSFPAGAQEQVSVRYVPDGRVCAVWRSDGQDGTAGLPGIVGNCFDADGGPTGAERVIHATLPGVQLDPWLGVGADGRALVTWSAVDQDGDALGVFARTAVIAVFADGFESGDISAWSAAVP